MSEPCDLPAVELRQLIGAKRLSPVELWTSCQQRIEETNPALNAIVARDDEAATVAARSAEEMVMEGEPLGPMHGLPLGIKDLNETAGLVTTFGSPLYADNMPLRDEPMVARLREAGALIAVKTNTPEFGAGANTWNKVYGATGNPFDPAKTCAGSSGGSAVALAASMVPLASGSDLGGSLRTPASYCGVVGLRPTPGLVPNADGLRVFSPLSVEGPMGRSVADLALMLSVMAAQDANDPFSRPEAGSDLTGLPTPADPNRLTVAISEDLGGVPMSQQVRRLFRERLARFSHIFKECEERRPPLRNATEIFIPLRALGFLAGYRKIYESQPEMLGPNVAANIEMGLSMSASDIAEAEAEHTRLYHAFLKYMDKVDLLICPVAAVQPFDKEKLYPDEIDGAPLPNYISWIGITFAITLTGHPAIVLPCGLDEDGLPFGIQIVGKRWQERDLLAMALAIEAELACHPETRRPLPDLGKLSAR